MLCGRPIARINGIGEEGLGLIGPELADVRIGLVDDVHEPPVLALDLADIDRADHVAIIVECHRPAHRIDAGGLQRSHEGLLVIDLAADRFQRAFQHGALDISRGGVETRIIAELLAEIGGECVVQGAVDPRRIPTGGHDPQGLVAHVAQHGFVERRHAADDLHLFIDAIFHHLAHEAEAVRSGEAEEDRVRIRELRHIGSVIGRGERREQLLDHLSAIVLEHALEARAHFMAVGNIVGNHRHALVLELLDAVVGERMRALGRS